MKVRFYLPRPAEAVVRFDEKSNVLTIEPIFYRADRAQTLAHVVVDGNAGAQLKFLLEVSGAKGHLKTTALRPVESAFDRKRGESAGETT